MSFQTLPDGPPPADFGGGPATLLSNPVDDAGTKLRVSQGKLTNDSGFDGRAAGYYTSADLGAPVTTIGASWTFTARGGTAGAMALIVSQKALDIPFSVHLVITPTGWSFGVWPPGDSTKGDLRVVASGEFDRPLQQDGARVYRAQVEIRGARADVELPDNRSAVVEDDRIAEWAGPFATFEAFADHGLTDSRVGFSEIWAKSGVG